MKKHTHHRSLTTTSAKKESAEKQSKSNNVTIPKSHPRAVSLFTREKLVKGYHAGLVAEEGLMAHGRGEAFDYLTNEKTGKGAKRAIRAAALVLLSSQFPVISVNGNTASLCPLEIVRLAKVTGAKLEVNLFYLRDSQRKRRIAKLLKDNGADHVLGISKGNLIEVPKLKSSRRYVDKNGIYKADVVLVPLEDGDRTIALKKFDRKKVITFDLNPLSRTAQTADITIVDNITRGIKLLTEESKRILQSYNKTTNKKDSSKETPQNGDNTRNRVCDTMTYSRYLHNHVPILLTAPHRKFLSEFSNEANLRDALAEIQRNLISKRKKPKNKRRQDKLI